MDVVEDIEKELEEKSIERDLTGIEVVEAEVAANITSGTPHEVGAEEESKPVKKTKRVRSEKQIAAFEKARLKRAEGIAARKKEKEEIKEQKKLQKQEEKKVKFKPEIESVISKEQSISKPVINTTPSVAGPREQVVQNHYYYYGTPPPDHAGGHNNTRKKKKKKSKRPPTPSSSSASESESESEEEEKQIQQQQQYYEVPKPSYKFSYA